MGPAMIISKPTHTIELGYSRAARESNYSAFASSFEALLDLFSRRVELKLEFWIQHSQSRLYSKKLGSYTVEFELEFLARLINKLSSTQINLDRVGSFRLPPVDIEHRSTQ